MSNLLTIREFADQLKLTPATVYAAISEGRLKAVVELGRLAVPKKELDRFKRRKNGSRKKVLKAA